MRGHCGICRFWDISISRREAPMDTGACRRALPTRDERNGAANWPLSLYEDWCSHYRPDADQDPLRPMMRFQSEQDDDMLF